MFQVLFLKIAQKIYTDVPIIDTINNIELKSKEVKDQYEEYFNIANKYKSTMPNLIGMPAMDAIAILENMNIYVQLIGSGNVIKQSVKTGVKVIEKSTVILELS